MKIEDADGRDRTPAGRKACGLLALLALSPNGERSRKWLQDKLWSDRGEVQGADSLRQALSEIRRAFGRHRPLLVADRFVVRLDVAQMEIECLAATRAGHAGDLVLLDGLDIKDDEFEAWLSEQRRRFEDLPNGALPAAPRDPRPMVMGAAPARRWLYLNRIAGAAAGDRQMLADSLSDAIARIVSETGTAAVAETQFGSDPATGGAARAGAPQGGALSLTAQAGHLGDQSVVRFVMRDTLDGRLIWSDLLPLRAATEQALKSNDILLSINNAAGIAIEEFTRQYNDSPRAAASLCAQGVRTLYRHGLANYEAADRLFSQAYDTDPQAVFLAWRAYLRSFIIAERLSRDSAAVADEANEFCRMALEREPHNAFILSLCAHVQSTVNLAFVPAFEFAQRSIELCPSNPIAWVSLAIAESHLGRPASGIRYARKARAIAGSTPFRFHIDLLSCIVGVMSGDFREARRYGEASHANAPRIAAPLRFLTALYFHDQDELAAERAVGKLQQLEPDFSLDLLRDPSYPSESLRKSNLLRCLPRTGL